LFKILAIVEREVSRGFRFSGVDIKVAESSEHAKKLLLETMGKKDYGIVIIDEGYLKSFDEPTKKMIEDSSSPLIVPVPLEMKWHKNNKKREDSYVREMIRRAIGYRIKIK
jgi:vacuolar-type H+-ATPase subunit F/Vma7